MAVDRNGSAELKSSPAPTGGWNTLDPLAEMPKGDAALLTNLIPDTNGVRLRDGYSQFCETGSAHVDFLKTFDTPFGPRFIAASSKALYDITTGTASSIKTGFFRDDWNSAVMNGRMGLVNGGDDPVQLSFAPGGIEISNLTLQGTPSPEKFKVIHVYKSRSYFATGTEPEFWYSAVNALGGTVTRFPIDRVSGTGGNVIDIKSWTIDGGSGPDDFFVLFLDSGEVIVYQGDDPGGGLTTWALVGRYSVGKIITSVQFAGQIHAVTDFDYNVFPRDFENQGLTPPTKLSGAAKQSVKQKGGLPRWQVLFVPNRGLKIINVPQSESAMYQHVTNLSSGGHCLFKDLNATRWELFKGELYFGDISGNVNRYGGTSDNGTAISWEMATAPDRLGSHHEKNILEYRSVISGEGALTESTGIGYDYQGPEFMQSMTTQALGTPWNTSPWDTSEWSQAPQTKDEWFTGTGSGQAVQYFSRGSVKGFTPVWHSIDYLYEMSDVH